MKKTHSKLLIAISTRYFRTPDGEIWTKTAYDRQMWQEYQEVFPEVKIFARLISVDTAPAGSKLAGGTGIEFFRIPEWNSIKGLIFLPEIFSISRYAVQDCGAAILHSPSLEAGLISYWASKKGIPIALECRGEQSMSRIYWKKRGLIFNSILAGYHQRQFHDHLKKAWGCVFVADQLKKRYLKYLREGSHSVVISDVRIPESFFSKKELDSNRYNRTLSVVNIGRLDAQKDQLTLLKACAQLCDYGITRWELHLIGEGPLFPVLVRQAEQLGIRPNIVFHGFIPWGESLFSLLDKMDLFVLSSLNEGMPRVLIEAMARGLPCISTEVSGADELLGDSNLVPAGKPDLLANRIAEVMKSPEKRAQLADQCWSSVQDFRQNLLKERKKQFLQDFKEYVRMVEGQLP